jgi:hypothetical protein
MSLRKPINDKCRDCSYDSLDRGTAAQKIACCVDTDCPLHPVRPITTKGIPIALLQHWRVKPSDLCDRARPLVENASSCSVEGQFGHLAGRTQSTYTDGVGCATPSQQEQE